MNRVSLVFGLALATLLVLPFAAVVLAVIRIDVRRRSRRVLARVVCLPPLFLFLIPIFLPWTSRSFESGRWCCLVCGAAEERTLCAGFVVHRRPTRPDEDPYAHGAYKAWFDAHAVALHEHDWRPSGCHHVGLGTTSCHMWPAAPLHEVLRTFPDTAAAIRLATRFAEWSPARRDEWLRTDW